MQKLIANTWKIIKTKNHHTLIIGMEIIYMDLKCHKYLPVSDFKWVEYISEFSEDFIKSYNDGSDEGYFLFIGYVDIQYPKNLHNFHNDIPFLPERMKIEKKSKACS